MTTLSRKAVGIFGGTFDPVHYGHLRPALEVQECLGFHEVRMLPSARPPHRAQPGASAEHRMEMLRQAIADAPRLVADDCELRRPGSSYMVDTLEDFRARFPETPLALIIGQDAANALDHWHEWRRLFDLAHIVVMRRPEARGEYRDELALEMQERRVEAPEEIHRSTAGCVLPVEITQLEISSTAIRDLIAGGRTPLFLTPPQVIEYILRHGLYLEKRGQLE